MGAVVGNIPKCMKPYNPPKAQTKGQFKGQSVLLVEKKCNNCGQNDFIRIDDNTIKCTYCGSEFYEVNMDEKKRDVDLYNHNLEGTTGINGWLGWVNGMPLICDIDLYRESIISKRTKGWMEYYENKESGISKIAKTMKNFIKRNGNQGAPVISGDIPFKLGE